MKLKSLHQIIIENNKKYPSSVSDVNKFLKSKNVKEKLAKGRGYYYFTGGDASSWYQSGVYVYSIGELTYEQWYDE